MKLPRARFTVLAMMIALAIIATLLGQVVRALRPDCRLQVVNRSGQSISHLAVTLSGEVVVIDDLADGVSVTVPFRAHESPSLTVKGALVDESPIQHKYQLLGDPKRFPQIVGTVEPGGKFRLSLSPEQWTAKSASH